MSIQSEITRIQAARDDIASAISAKGVAVPGSTKIDGMAAKIAEIEAGDDTDWLRCIEDPTINWSLENEKITRVGQYKFHRCWGLTSVSLPNATAIGSNAFSYCGKLTAVHFQRVRNISGSAFSSCGKLNEARFPSGAPAKDHSITFAFCPSLTIAEFCYNSNQSWFERQTFYGCTSLATLILRGENVIQMANTGNVFTDTPIEAGTGLIYVPRALLAAYQGAENWTAYAAQFRAIEDYPDITGGTV